MPRLREEAERVRDLEPRDEPLVERATPSGDVVRVNLRPYMRRGGSLEALYGAMVESSKFGGDPMRFLRLWRRFKDAASRLNVALDEGEVCEIDDALGERGPVPMHHTAEYREAYYPAYRVARRVDLEAIGLL
ncbi:hypothetical protein E2P71_04520 [Candidatus Bathyarchaeota archaeon]|nr:hypothetical protein E2P71_04520 [Candidatus Bathyarchaeota archaeon]